jgi:hypothetical protein
MRHYGTKMLINFLNFLPALYLHVSPILQCFNELRADQAIFLTRPQNKKTQIMWPYYFFNDTIKLEVWQVKNALVIKTKKTADS